MAVFTPVSNEEMQKFLMSYPARVLTNFAPVAEGDEDTVYKLETDQGPVFFNLFERQQAETDLNILLSFQQHLNFKKYPCPRIIPDTAGEFVNQMQNKPAVLLGFMPGAQVESPSSLQCHSAGRALGWLHKLSEDFTFLAAPSHQMATLKNLQKEIEGSLVDSLENHSLVHTLMQQAADVEHNPPPFERPVGMVHGDFTPENILFMGQDVSGVVDFSQAGAETYGYDLALALNTFGFDERGDFRATRFQAFLAGYEETRPLTVAERRAFNFELRRSGVWLATKHLHQMLFPKKEEGEPRQQADVWFKRLDFHIRRNELADYANF